MLLLSQLCSKQYNKRFVLRLIVAPQLGGGQRHNYSTKTRQAGHANEQSYSYVYDVNPTVSSREDKVSKFLFCCGWAINIAFIRSQFKTKLGLCFHCLICTILIGLPWDK
jgi:hypothetical protein